MAGVAPLRALQRLVALAFAGEAAPRSVHERDDAVDVGILLQDAGACDGLGHEAGDGGRAVHAGEHADVVARAGLAVGAAVALEGGARLVRQQRLLARILGEGVVALELGEGAVVAVHVVAGGDVLGGEADDLPEFQHRLALGDRARCHLVAAHDPGHGRDALRGYPRHHRVDGDDDVVLGIEPQRARVVLVRLVLHGRLPVCRCQTLRV